MSAVEVSWDDADGEHDATADRSLLEDLVRSLDGRHRTHVSIGGPDAHLVCGGSAATGLVLFIGLDGETHQLLAAKRTRRTGSVELVAAGQPGDYPARFVVDLARALDAARTFLQESALDSSVEWELER